MRTPHAAFNDRAAVATYAAGTPADHANAMANAMAAGQRMVEQLPLLSANEEEHLLQAAGFVDVERFYTALSFQGWVASVP